MIKQPLSRRHLLKGLGASFALPFLEAMVPPGAAPARKFAAGPMRLSCIEMVHGAAGSTDYGGRNNLWSPGTTGREFDLSPTSLSPLEPFRDYLTIISGTDIRNAASFEPSENGGDHIRSSATFLTQARPKRTDGSDVRAGTSLDQIVAGRIGAETPLGSLQLSIEQVTKQQSRFNRGYSNLYRDTISWASPTRPLPMISDPRAIFDQLFGGGTTPEQWAANRKTDLSLLDWVVDETRRLARGLGAADRSRLDEYLNDVREVERRIQKIEAFNTSGERRSLPDAPVGVSADFEEHVKLMFDLQVQAFASDTTRVTAFKMGLDGSPRVYPGSGVTEGFHAASHHSQREGKIETFARINRYHVSLVPYFLDKLKRTREGDASLLDRTLVMYGSPMGNSNFHKHKRCPLFLAGRAGDRIKGNLHVKTPDGTPMANAMLTVLHSFGLDEIESFGDSNGTLDLTSLS
jgi:hypothetical protein